MSVDRQKKFWDSMAGDDPDAGVIDPRDSRGFKNRYIQELRNHYFVTELANNELSGPVLDFGCGTGLVTEFLSNENYRVVGVDIAPQLLKHGKSVRPQLDLVQFNGKNLPFKNDTFAAIVIYVVLNYLDSDKELEELSRELNRVLKPGGRLYKLMGKVKR